ncbi:hypothetical protein PITC_073400 [Penicillium italicum]|uniref:BTB domain-containing protein n=1 Tax=Penicillium italicum TaxID=40296 RepID=A0A0A2L7L0_PENIT|nr:hypothetical protein PITC_073400 [Penicillium italicum]
MAATSTRLSESFFEDLPIQLKVGKQGNIFHVHPRVFMPFTSSAIYARVYGSWKERGEEALDLTEFDEHTIVCFLSYVYARDYCPFPAAPDSNLEIEEQIKKFNLKTSGKKSHNEGLLDGEETISDHPATDGLKTRPLTPIEDFMILEQFSMLQSATKTLGLAEGRDELLAIEILTHAKVYCFAHVYLLTELEVFALNRLAKALVILQNKQISMSPQLVEAIRLIYSKTPDSSQNHARNLLSQFVALKFTALLGDQLCMLMSEGGCFAVEVSYKLGRRLLVNPLEDQIEQLHLKVSALESECSGMEKDLKQSREEVRGWEQWDQNLPSKRQRWPGRYYDI